MRLLYADDFWCDGRTLQRLILIADEIGFADRASIMLGQWGTIGAASPVRRFDTSASPVPFTYYTPESGPARPLQRAYIEADLANPRFVQLVLRGLASEPAFAKTVIAPEANYASGTGREIVAHLLQDPTLPTARLDDVPLTPEYLFQPDTEMGRRSTLKSLVITASSRVTNALVTAEEYGMVPVSDTATFSALLALRTSDPDYLGAPALVSPQLRLAVARCVVPDAALDKLNFRDLFEYRAASKDAYTAWSVEIERLAEMLSDVDPATGAAEIPKLITKEIQPKLIEYRNEMISVRDKLWGDLIKNYVSSAKWSVPAVLLTQVSNSGLLHSLAAFAAIAQPAVPAVVDYFTQRRDTGRRNSMSYLVGVTNIADDGADDFGIIE